MNIPHGYDVNGERSGNGVMENDIKEGLEQRFLKCEFTHDEAEIIDKALVELGIQTNFPPADRETLGKIISISEKLRLARIEDEASREN